MNQRRGFTLIELLIVLGIIALLVALTAQAVGAVRAESRAIVCATNLRTIGQTILAYTSQWRGRLPNNSYALRDNPAQLSLPEGTYGQSMALLTGEGSTSNLQWHDVVAQQLGWKGERTIAARFAAGQHQTFRYATQYLWCPDVEQALRDPTVLATSYGISRRISLNYQKKFIVQAGVTMNDFKFVDYLAYSRVPQPADFVLLAEYNFRNGPSGPYNVDNMTLANLRRFVGVALTPTTRHRGLNYLFFDGHVARLRTPPHPMETNGAGTYLTIDGQSYSFTTADFDSFAKQLGEF